jgi:hypothetical protein
MYSNLTNDGVPLIADLGALMLKTPDWNDFSVAGLIGTCCSPPTIMLFRYVYTNEKYVELDGFDH